MLIRRVGPEDLPWLDEMLEERWGGPAQVVNGESYRPADLPGFVATDEGRPVGYAALRVVDGVAEIGLIDAIRPRQGAGRALVEALDDDARKLGCSTMRAVTTNDNRVAQAFYEALGFERVGVRRGAVTRGRAIKPSIPLVADDGTPMADEWIYERPIA